MPKVKVKIFDLELAHQRWYATFGRYLEGPHQSHNMWHEFLGSQVEASPRKGGYWTSKEAHRKIMLLASPHWKTILEAWKIQNDYPHNRSDKL